jgi:hypothetical protein
LFDAIKPTIYEHCKCVFHARGGRFWASAGLAGFANFLVYLSLINREKFNSQKFSFLRPGQNQKKN